MSIAWLALFVACLGDHTYGLAPASWMGDITRAVPSLAQASILDFTLPGSHDSLSYDLSTSLTESAVTPPGVGEIVRRFAITQTINLTQQLDAGVRLLDFRIMWSSGRAYGGRKCGGWYGTHTVRTNLPAESYLLEIRNWARASPGELIVLYITRHGNACLKGHDQYPGVTRAQKRVFWESLTGVFGDYLVPASMITASYDDVVRAGHRIYAFLADHVEMTNSSRLGIDACVHVNNTGGGGRPSLGQWRMDVQYYETLKARQARTFYLRSLAAAAKEYEVGYFLAGKLSPFPSIVRARRSACSRMYAIPNVTDWCASSLEDLGRFCNYYNQWVLDYAWSSTQGGPSAYYVDMILPDGLIDVGDTQHGYDLWGATLRATLVGRERDTPPDVIGLLTRRQATWPSVYRDDFKTGRIALPPGRWPA